MKKCTKCGVEKETTEFNKRNSRPCGFSSECKMCLSHWQKNNKDKVSIISKKHSDKIFNQYGVGVSTIHRFGLKLALIVYDRAKRKCEICDSKNDLAIHHLDNNGRHNKERGEDVNNNIENLQVLCKKCHGSLHGKQNKRR